MDAQPSSPFSDDALRQIAKEKILLALGVKIHALSFIGVNIFLVLLNSFYSGFWWALIVLSGWLVALVVHVASYLIYARGVIGGNKKAIILHFISEAVSVQAVIVINLISSPDIYWFIWPVGAMAAAVFVHMIIFIMLQKRTKPTGERKSWLQTKIDEEINKVKHKK